MQINVNLGKFLAASDSLGESYILKKKLPKQAPLEGMIILTLFNYFRVDFLACLKSRNSQENYEYNHNYLFDIQFRSVKTFFNYLLVLLLSNFCGG